MLRMRRRAGVLGVLVLVLTCLSAWAEPRKISIQDWSASGPKTKVPETATSPEPESTETSRDIPAEAMMPALEETPTPEPSVTSPAVEPSAALTPAAGETAKAETSPEPEHSADSPGRVKSINEWVAQNPEPEPAPEAAAPNAVAPTNGNGVKIPGPREVSVGQVRTGAGEIDLNAIDLDRLNEELQRVMPQRETLSMTMQEAVQTALTHNRDIVVTSYEPLKAEADIMAARGEFDPVLSGTYSHLDTETKASSQISSFTGGLTSGGSGLLGGGGNSNILGNVLRSVSRSNLFGDDEDGNSGFTLGRLLISGLSTVVSSAGNTVRRFATGGDEQELFITQETDTYEATLQGKIPWGTQYQVKLQVDEEKSTYSNNVAEFSGGLTLSVTQPLLRGRGPKANLARIRIAKNNREVAENQLMQQVMTTVSDVVKAYWDLVGAIEQLAVRETSLENAQRLLDVNQRRLDIGIGAALDVVQAKASVAQRTSDVISARTQVINAEDRLKLLLDIKDNEEFSHKRIAPADAPTTIDLNLDERESIARAFENRPELKSADLEIDSAELERYRTANEMQMKLDLSGTVFQGGRGEDAGVVFDGIADRSDNSYSVKIAGEIPITNRAARGQYEKARLAKRQAEERKVKTANEIAINVRNAIRQAATTRILVESSGQARALQETNVAAEEKRLKLGITTSFEVLRTQEDLANAQAQEVQAKIDFEKALTDLKLAEGTILASLNVEFAPPEPEKPIGFVRSIVPPAPKDE